MANDALSLLAFRAAVVLLVMLSRGLTDLFAVHDSPLGSALWLRRHMSVPLAPVHILDVTQRSPQIFDDFHLVKRGLETLGRGVHGSRSGGARGLGCLTPVLADLSKPLALLSDALDRHALLLTEVADSLAQYSRLFSRDP
jgi:hypothetical protein